MLLDALFAAKEDKAVSQILLLISVYSTQAVPLDVVVAGRIIACSQLRIRALRLVAH